MEVVGCPYSKSLDYVIALFTRTSGIALGVLTLEGSVLYLYDCIKKQEEDFMSNLIGTIYPKKILYGLLAFALVLLLSTPESKAESLTEIYNSYQGRGDKETEFRRLQDFMKGKQIDFTKSQLDTIAYIMDDYLRTDEQDSKLEELVKVL